MVGPVFPGCRFPRGGCDWRMETDKALGSSFDVDAQQAGGTGEQGDAGDTAVEEPNYNDRDFNRLDAVPGAEPAAIDIGDRVTVVVTGIAEYGVFVTTSQGHRGLIHISEISDWFVEDARDYFYIGEELQVEVISKEEGTGKYAFSTRRLGGKQPVGDGYTRRLMSFQPNVDRPAAGRSVAAGRRDRFPGPGRPKGREHEEIASFLQRRVGEVSAEASRLLVDLVARYGPVRVALALADVTRRFDRSLALVNWVARSLEQGEPYAAQEPEA